MLEAFSISSVFTYGRRTSLAFLVASRGLLIALLAGRRSWKTLLRLEFSHHLYSPSQFVRFYESKYLDNPFQKGKAMANFEAFAIVIFCVVLLVQSQEYVDSYPRSKPFPRKER